MIIDSERVFVEDCRVIDVKKLGSYFEIVFESKYISKSIQPGQFVNVKLNTTFFRRPFTLFDKGQSWFSVLIKVVGRGTNELSQAKEGQVFNILGPLGNSVFDLGIHTNESVDLVAGGVGIANMLVLSKFLKTSNKRVRLFWGIKTKEEYFEKNFEYLDKVFITSEDGGVGEKGFITSLLQREYNGSVIYTCGPIPMIKAIAMLDNIPNDKVVCSLERVMGCGVGLCYGCNIGNPEKGYLLVCKDGPNFRLSDVVEFIV